MKNNNLKSIFYALLAVFFWSTVATAFKLSLKGLSPVQLLFYASLTSTILLFFILFYKNKNDLILEFQKDTLIKNLLFGLLNPFLYYIVLFKAYSLLPAQEAQPLNYTWPIVMAVFSSFFLKHKLTFKVILGLVISFLGVIVIATHGDIFRLKFQNTFGVILAVGSSLIWAAFWTLNLLDKRGIINKLFGAFFTGTIFTAIYIFLFGSFYVKDKIFILGAVYTGFFEMGITFLFWLKALDLSNNKAKTSTLAYLSPFISLIFIAFVLGEKILPSSIIGLILIVGGILYQHLSKEKLPGSIAFKNDETG